MNCNFATKQFSLMLYGELSFDEEELLQRHLDGCEACRTELTRVTNIHRALESEEFDLDAPLLTDCRRTLRVSVAALGPERRQRWFDGLSLQSFLKPAGALALLAIGFAG